MLIRSSVNSMLMLWKRGDNLFSQLPLELILSIKHLPTPDHDFLETLHNVAFGELNLVKATLEEAKVTSDKTNLMRLLLQAADVITPAGKLIKGVTLLECALGAGDIEMAAMIKPYFDDFKGGKNEFEQQRERYRSCIKGMATQQHDYDITSLIEILKISSQNDVEAELALGNQFDPTHNSPLRIAMNEFRKHMLEPKRRIINKPSMHCNYKNFDHIDEVLCREWDKLKEGNNDNKNQLISRQVYGLMQLLELPAYERCVHAQDDYDAAITGHPIKRSFNYKYTDHLGQAFPVFSIDHLQSHTGVGFATWVNLYGGGRINELEAWNTGNEIVSSRRSNFNNCIQQKQIYAQMFIQQKSQEQPNDHPSNDQRFGCVIL